MARVALEQLCKIYPGPKGQEIFAVKDVNLTIADKEFLVLVGPSGCGKSTTLRMIAGLEDISRGTIRIDDQVVNQVEPKDRDIAMVFQNYALYPHMTVYENMAFGLQLRKLPKAEIDQRVREAAQILGLTDLLERLPKALSGGQRQRVAVGRAITRKPKVFLFDEPLSNLDAQMRVQMRLELSRLHRQLAATMVYVTHDQVEAMTMGDRIVVMKDGVIQQVDKPLALYQRPANLFVAGFIGSPPMNILRGKISTENGTLFFTEEASGADVLKLPVPPQWKSTLGAKNGETVLLGLRAEHITTGNAGTVAGTAVVEMVELLGAETLVHLRTSAHGLVARCGGGVFPKVGERLPLQLQTEHAIFFDPASGLTLQ